MPAPRRFIWDSAPLDALIEASGLSLEAVSKGCGVTYSALMGYRRKTSNPSIASLVAMADFFAVPLDYLMGRCDKETAEAILKDYPARFMELRRAPYESYLGGRRPFPENHYSQCYEAPWPYNLLDAASLPFLTVRHRISEIDNCWPDIVTDDQMAGLEKALNTLTERERTFTLNYFKEGLNLEECGKLYNVTRERTRQIISKAVRKLRHPSRFRMIVLGIQGAEQESENKKRRAAIMKEAADLDTANRALEFLRDGLYQRIVSLSNVSYAFRTALDEALPGPSVPASFSVDAMSSTPIEDLDLSVRSYNCLRRADINTFGELLDRLRLDPKDQKSIIRVRNLGRKSLTEVCAKVEHLTGVDYLPYVCGYASSPDERTA